MALELEGNILLDRAPTRRWVSIIAVVIPAAAFAMLSTWFIRAYIAPPTVKIASTTMVASASPQMPVQAAPAVEAKIPDRPMPVTAPVVAQIAPPQPAAVESAAPAASVSKPAPPVASANTLPMFQTLTAAPPMASTPAFEPMPVPVPESPAAMTTTGVAQATSEEPAIENSEPIAGAVPLPRARPRFAMARVIGPVPLPRPKPAEELPPPDLPAIDIHAIQ